MIDFPLLNEPNVGIDSVTVVVLAPTDTLVTFVPGVTAEAKSTYIPVVTPVDTPDRTIVCDPDAVAALVAAVTAVQHGSVENPVWLQSVRVLFMRAANPAVVCAPTP